MTDGAQADLTESSLPKKETQIRARRRAVTVKGVPAVLFLLPLLLVIALAPLYQPAHAASSGPSSVVVGVWLINVGKVDLSSGSSDLDFYIWFNSSTSGTPQHVSFEFMNGSPSSVSVIESSPSYQEYRVRGTFQNSMDFRNFPFDSHTISVEVEDTNLSSSSLLFVPDAGETGIDPNINIAGWDITGHSAQAVYHTYPGNENYSRFVFSFDIGRSALSSMLKSVMPIAIITTIAMLAFLVSAPNYAQRIGLGVTALLAAVAAHLTLVSQIPPVGYLTVGDKIMITAYGLFLYGLLISVLLMRKVDQQKLEDAERLNRRAGFALPLVVLAILAPLLLLT